MAFTAIANYTGSSVSAVDIPLTSSGLSYTLIGAMTPVTDSVNLQMRVTDDGFSTVETGSVYRWIDTRFNSGGLTHGGSDSATLIQLATNVGNAAGEFWSGQIHINNPHKASFRTDFDTTHLRTNSAGFNNVGMGGFLYDVAASINGVRLFFSSGNVSSYNLYLWAETTS